MSRKAWISVFAVMAAMVIVMVAGTHFLYRKDSRNFKPVDERYGLAYAVPANAVAVFFFSEAENISSPVLSSFDFPKKLSDFLQSGKAGRLAGSRMALSLHYTGSLTPLYVIDAGPCSDKPSAGADSLMCFAQKNGLVAEFVNCATLAPESHLASRSLILLAKTNSQIRVSKRHLSEGSSFLDSSGLREAAADSPEDVLFLSYAHARVLFEKAVSREHFVNRYDRLASSQYSLMASFFSTFADWGTVDLSSHQDFSIVQHYTGTSGFMGVLSHDSPSVSHVSEVLPYSTRFVLTLPMGESASYISSYQSYLESVRRAGVVADWQEKLRKKTRLKPGDFIKRLGVSEVATASFKVNGNIERVNLIRIHNADTLLLRGTGFTKIHEARSSVAPYAFPEYVASVFGSFFDLADESSFTLVDDWLITGSHAAVAEYAGGEALKYNLKSYMADAGKTDLLAERLASCVAYLDIPASDKDFTSVLKKDMLSVHDNMKGAADYSPMVMSVFCKDGKMHSDLTAFNLKMKRLRPEKFRKEAMVKVPDGPFRVVNSGTGRDNFFYQQPNGAICLKEEDGKGIWGVPFKEKLCGTAQNIDYYGNGNLQILFGAGSSIYVIDRRGAFVSGFPKDLGKDILLGPGLYESDVEGQDVLMVLHKDNTLEMYGLNGKKPSDWRCITSEDLITDLPEMITVGGKNYWVVRTSVQTLIYPFYGGAPFNSFSGSRMFLPTADVKVSGDDAVKAECYDGKTRKMILK